MATNDSAATKAARYVRSRGFTPEDTDDFTTPPSGGLHVIVATASGSADGYAQRAFFFVGGRFLRTDLPESSAGINIAWRNETTIGLSYAVYKAADAMCCPTGGAIIVRYRWNGTRLKALDPIPPALARR